MKRGFTLVETLTTISVIALLLGLLAPALSSARASSRRMRCLSNLQQMATAAHAYAAIYDAFPVAVRYDNSTGSFRTIAWDWITAGPGAPAKPGPLWGFTTNPGEVQQCPDHVAPANSSGDPYTGYNYNTSYVGGEAPFPHVGWARVRRGIAPAQCRRAEFCAMFGDGGWKGGSNKFMRAPLNHEGVGLSAAYAGGQAFRHRGCTCIAYVDGHVGATRDSHPGAMASDALLNQTMSFPRNGFLSNDDSAYDPR